MTEKQPNTGLHTNVIFNRWIRDASEESPEEVSLRSTASRIPYWELLELTRVNPLADWSRELDRLTEVQQQQKQLFLDPGPRVRHFYPVDDDLRVSLFLWANDHNPFLDLPAEGPISVTEADVEELPDIGESDELPEDSWDDDDAELEEEDESVEDADDELEDEESDWDEELERDPNQDEQLAIIEGPADHHFLITAPPGTGKTHVLVQRLSWLIAQQWIENPNAETLVLSFSRAAVGEVIRRIQCAVNENDASDDLRYVDVRTFDSYATRMLMRGETDSGHLVSGYLQRIEQFTEALQEGALSETARDEIDALKLLVIDEVQDLIGCRARMTLEVMKRVCEQGGTVMLLGDPAQAIYDPEWAEPGGMSAEDFLAKAKTLLRGSSGHFLLAELTKYRRFKDDRLREFVTSCREIVGDGAEQPDFVKLQFMLGDYCDRKSFDESLEDVRDSVDHAAILTRTNLELFQAFEWCKDKDIACRAGPGSRGRFWPGWIARLFMGFSSDNMSFVLAQKRWEKYLADSPDENLFDEAMDFLTEERLRPDSDEEQLVPEAIIDRLSRFPPRSAWDRSGQSDRATWPLTISTIHGSKGLEFSRVFVLESSGRPRDKKKIAYETRLIYVAATRGSKRLSLVTHDPKIFRGGTKFYGNDRYAASKKTNHVIVKGEGAVEKILLVGIDEFNMTDFWEGAGESDFEDVQEEIWGLLQEDSPKLSLKADEEGRLHWQLPSGGKLCRPASPLESTLRKIRGGNPGGQFGQVELIDVPVIDVATVDCAWNHGRSSRAGMNNARLALMPVIYGMGWILKR